MPATDLSSSTPVLAFAAALAASFALGLSKRRQARPPALWVAALLGAAVAFASLFLASFLHTLCVESLHLCRSRGDANIGLALQPVLGWPFYVAALMLGSRWRTPAPVPAVEGHEAATARAVLLHHQGSGEQVLCPSCGKPVKLFQESKGGQRLHLLARCPCGRCNSRFQQDAARGPR